MDIQKEIKRFISQYQTTGWVILLMAGGLLIQGLLAMVMPDATYEMVKLKLVLPDHIRELVFQPWSILTYPFFISNFNILGILMTGLIIFAFGRIHQQFLNDTRTRRILVLAVPVIGLLSVCFSSLLPHHNVKQAVAIEESVGAAEESDPTAITDQESTQVESETTESTPANNKEANKAYIEGSGGNMFKHLRYPSGMYALMMFLVISCITLIPNYPIQVFIFGQVRILWVGLILLVLEIAMAGWMTPLAVSIMIGSALGFANISLLRKGTDLSEIIWSYYQEEKPPRMKVTYSSRRNEFGGEDDSPARKTDGKGRIPQEIVDGLLDKISDKGYDSLSREEKELLLKASNQREEDSRN
ncbi:MAG: DUF6576 domain-containing protein [Bacteroidota bacterium]